MLWLSGRSGRGSILRGRRSWRGRRFSRHGRCRSWRIEIDGPGGQRRQRTRHALAHCAGRVDVDIQNFESVARELHITLTKASRGEPWPAAFAAHAPADVPEPPDAGRLLLERFAEDHPGFDFSSASLTGAAPDPRTFLREEEEPE